MLKHFYLLALGLITALSVKAQYPNAYAAEIGKGYYNDAVFATYSTPAAWGTPTTSDFTGSLGSNSFTITFTNTSSLGNGGFGGAATGPGNGAALAARNWGPSLKSSNGSRLPGYVPFVDMSYRGSPIPTGSHATATFTNTLSRLDQLVMGDVDFDSVVTVEFLDTLDNPVNISGNIKLIHTTDDDSGHSLPVVIGTTSITINPNSLINSVDNEGWSFAILKDSLIKSIRITQSGNYSTFGSNSFSFTFAKTAPDRGDAPASYGDPRISPLAALLRLGTLGGDAEASTQYSANAQLDNVYDSTFYAAAPPFLAYEIMHYEDEDGVASITPIVNDGSFGQIITNYSVTA